MWQDEFLKRYYNWRAAGSQALPEKMYGQLEKVDEALILADPPVIGQAQFCLSEMLFQHQVEGVSPTDAGVSSLRALGSIKNRDFHVGQGG